MDIFPNDPSIIERILAFLVYVGAFAAIPLLAKAFAGALNQLSGMINDRSKGLLDRGRNKMKEHAERGYKHARERRGESSAEKTQAGKKRLNWKRFLAGGSLRDKSAINKKSRGKRAAATTRRGRLTRRVQQSLNRRQFADERFAVEQDKQHQEVVDRAQHDMSGRGLEQHETTANDYKEPLYRRQAALAHLTKAGAVPHLRRIIALAIKRGAEDPNLHLALFNTKRSGALFEEKIGKAAPDLATLSFHSDEKAQKGEMRVRVTETPDSARLSTIGKTRGKDVNELDVSTLRISLGLKAEKTGDKIGIPVSPTERSDTTDGAELRRIIIQQIEGIMHPENKLGQASIMPEQIKLFEHVIKNKDLFLD